MSARTADGRRFAVKTMIVGDVYTKPEFTREIEILEILKNHPNIVKLYSYEIDDTNLDEIKISFILELLSNSLNDMKKTDQSFFLDEIRLIKYIQQIIFTLSFMQKKGILHRDIKPSNICLSIQGNIKFIDFGCSEIISKITNNELETIGTPNFMSPELNNAMEKDGIFILQINENFTIRTSQKLKCSQVFKSDVFSLGVTLLDLINFPMKFINRDIKKRNKILENFKNSNVIKSESLKNLIVKMLDWDHKTRPDMIELEDFLIYTMNCPLDYYVPFALIDSNDPIFVNEQNFPSLWSEKDIDKASEFFFKDGLFRSIKIPETFFNMCLNVKPSDPSAIMEEIKKSGVTEIDFNSMKAYLEKNFLKNLLKL